jgi:hypothetical protein
MIRVPYVYVLQAQLRPSQSKKVSVVIERFEVGTVSLINKYPIDLHIRIGRHKIPQPKPMPTAGPVHHELLQPFRVKAGSKIIVKFQNRSQKTRKWNHAQLCVMGWKLYSRKIPL